jgi:hypothetical protein
MKSRVFARKLLAACTVTMAASAAHAGITVFTDRAAYLKEVTGSVTDNFNDLAMSETAGPLSRMAGPYRYQVSVGSSDAGFYPSGSGTDTWLSPTLSSDVVTFDTFSPGVYGFGGNFFGTDSFGSFMPGRTVLLSAASGTDNETFTLSNASQDSFVAFLSDRPLTSISFQNMESDGPVYWAAVNDVVLAVPEPATWSMVLGGLGVAALARRRGSKSKQAMTVV